VGAPLGLVSILTGKVPLTGEAYNHQESMQQSQVIWYNYL
jgi:hypothetical protein